MGICAHPWVLKGKSDSHDSMECGGESSDEHSSEPDEQLSETDQNSKSSDMKSECKS